MAKKKESKQKKMNVRVDFTPMVDMMMLLITFFMLCTSLAKPQAMQLTMPSKDQASEENKDKAKTDRLVTLYLCPNDKLYYYIIEKKEQFGDEQYLLEASYGTGEGDLKGIREVLRSYVPSEAERRNGGTDMAPVQAVVNAKEQLDKWKKAQPHAKQAETDSIYDAALNMISKGFLDVVSNGQVNKARFDVLQKRDQTMKMKNPDKDPAIDAIKNQAKEEEVKDLTNMDFRRDGKTTVTLAVNIKPMDNSTYDNLVTILDEMQINCIGTYRISTITDQDLELLSKKVEGVEAPAKPAEAPAQ
ncbi:MAG: biopolymer transporter ExbD [Prevotella sp.]|nr:biopolymer transporter ExbD [Prevotella sp.]